MQLATEVYRQKLHSLLDELSVTEVREVYHFTIFLHNQHKQEEFAADIPSMPAEYLRSFVGLVAIGGDALRDSEALNAQRRA